MIRAFLFDLDFSHLEGLFREAGRYAEQQASCKEHITQCAQAERVARRNGEDPRWLQELGQEYAEQAERAAKDLAEVERAIRDEILRLDRMGSHSVGMQMRLVHFLEAHGRDGTAIAQRAVLVLPSSPAEAQALAAYLAERGLYGDAATAARQGWQRFGERALRAQWTDFLARAGLRDELIGVLSEDLLAARNDISLMERLAAELLAIGRVDETLDMMDQALAHPAGGPRLLAEFVKALVSAGCEAQGLELAHVYIQGIQNKSEVRRELAELLRSSGHLRVAVAFLDGEARAAPGDQEIAPYRTSYFVNSVRSERPAIRREAIALLGMRRDAAVERQLLALFAGSRGEELRLSMLAALGEIQGPDALPFLARALADNARRVRLAAARAIAGVIDGVKPWAEGSRGPLEEEGALPVSDTDAGALGQASHDGAAAPGSNGRGKPAASDPRSPGPAGPAVRPEAVRKTAHKVLAERLAVEADDGVRQGLVEALHRVDPRPRRAWERSIGLRSWAEPAPQARPLASPQQQRRRAGLAAAAIAALALVGVALAPIEPSPGELAWSVGQQYYRQAAGLVGTRIARHTATPTPAPEPSPAPARAEGRADTASGQVGEVVGADTVRVQLSGQTATVRYIGIEAPAAGEPGARAATDANRRLVAARLVYLESGVIAAESSGRWLRYVWLPEGQMASERLLELGFGVPSPDPQDTRYQQRLSEAATRAWQQKAGFWKGGADVYPMVAVKSPEVNVREAPGTNRPVKLQLKQGTVLAAVARNQSADWVMVRIPGQATGWISAQVVESTVPVRSLPLAQ